MAMTNLLRLKPAFSDEQIERLAVLFAEQLATKADLEALRLATKADLDALRVTTKADLDALRVEVNAGLEKLRLGVQRDGKGVEARLITWVVSQGAATIGILFALLHFTGR